MHTLLFSLALFGQADPALPPVPDVTPPAPTQAPAAAAASAPANESLEELKTWLLTRLIVDLSFDTKKATEVSRMLDTLNEREVRVLIGVYKEQAAKRDQSLRAQQDATQQQTLDQAKLNLQQAEAYRDHLKREYDLRLLQGYMTQNLVFQNNVNNQRLLYAPWSMYSYGPSIGMYGGPYGFNYSGVAYGAPAFGGALYYGNPYFRYGW